MSVIISRFVSDIAIQVVKNILVKLLQDEQRQLMVRI